MPTSTDARTDARTDDRTDRTGQQAEAPQGRVARLKARFDQLRRDHPGIDRVVRMQQHYSKARGNHLAGAITYFSFLSLFPLIAIAFAVLSYVVRYYPDAQRQVESFLTENLPGLVGTGPNQLNVQQIAANGAARISAGLVGIAGLLYSGLGWLDALRESLRQMWAVEPGGGNFVVKKLKDVVLLVLLGTAVLATTALSAVATSLSTQVLTAVGLGTGTGPQLLLQVLSVALAVLANTVILAIIFARLPGHRMPWKNMLTGALIAAVALEILKRFFAGLIIGNATGNPVYGTFAIVIGLLVWFNFMARIVMYGAAWCVVGPVPTLEAQVAAEGETLDEDEAAAASEAREDSDDDRSVPVGEPYKTSTGAVPVTTTGLAPDSGRDGRGPAGRTDSRRPGGRAPGRPGDRKRGGKGAAPEESDGLSLPAFAGVLALLAVRRRRGQ